MLWRTPTTTCRPDTPANRTLTPNVVDGSCAACAIEHNRFVDSLTLEVLDNSTAIFKSEVAVKVNGTPLAELVSPQLDASEWYGPPLAALAPPSAHLFGGPDCWYESHPKRRDVSAKVAILCCSCGMPECDALFVRITVLPDGVLWDEFEWRTRPTVTWPGMEFRFDRAAYEAEVARLDVDGGGDPDA